MNSFQIFVARFWSIARTRGMTQLPTGITLKMLYQMHGAGDARGAVESILAM